MFVPDDFDFKDKAEKIAFMKKYSFATIITVKGTIPIATQLPFIIDDTSGKLLLRSHFAIANEQVEHIVNNTSLVIFTEPHAYISPSLYEKCESVPTWDYIAIHAYGKARIIEDVDGKIELLEQMISYYEEEYMEQWKSLSEKFKKGMIRGITAFELEVTDFQGQKKLSQNKSKIERQRIVEHLEQSENTTEKDIAAYIKNELE